MVTLSGRPAAATLWNVYAGAEDVDLAAMLNGGGGGGSGGSGGSQTSRTVWIVLGVLLPLVAGALMLFYVCGRRAELRRKAALELTGLDSLQVHTNGDALLHGTGDASVIQPKTESAAASGNSGNVGLDSALLQHDHQQTLQL